MSRSQSQQPDTPSSLGYPPWSESPVEGRLSGAPSAQKQQPWSESARLQVVAARDHAWSECQQGVTRAQKYRAIRHYFGVSELHENHWAEARAIFDVHREELRAFLSDPMYGGNRVVPAGILGVISAREVEAERSPGEGDVVEPTAEGHRRWKRYGSSISVPAGDSEKIPAREAVEPTREQHQRWRLHGRSARVPSGSSEDMLMREEDAESTTSEDTVEEDSVKATRLKDVRIAAAARAFEESTDSWGLFFDYRDGTRVEIVVYAGMSEEEHTGMQIAEEKHLERMNELRDDNREANVMMAAVALAHEAFEASPESGEYFFNFQDGGRVRKDEYWRMSRRERAAMYLAEEKHLDHLSAVQEAVEVVDLRISRLARAYEESAEKEEFVFDHRDGSLIYVADYWQYSLEERAGVRRAKLERSKRMGDVGEAEARADVTTGVF